MTILQAETKIPFTDLYSQYEECKSEIDYGISRVINETDFLTGKNTEKFEKRIAEYCKAEACASVNSGSMALTCALKAVGVGAGDEVLTVGATFIATTEAILSVGAKPVYVDIDEFYHMDVTKMKNTDKMKAILFVDMYGQTPDIKHILSFAKRFQLKVIEDAAHSFGSDYNGKKVGSLVDLTCFSFNPVKNLGAFGDAGAVVGKSKYVNMVKILRNHGRGENGCTWQGIVGYNGRIDNLQAAVLEKKLKKVDSWIEEKREVAHRYTDALKDIVVVPKETPWSKHTYYVYVIMVEDRDNLRKFLSSRGIETRIHYAKPTFKSYDKLWHRCPKTENVSDMVLSLPCYHNLPEHHQDYIINSIKEYYNEGDQKHGV